MPPRQTQKSPSTYTAPALDKGLDIIEYLSSVGVAQSLTDISQALGRSTNELFRMLARLESRGYLLRDPSSGKYYLSLKLYHLSHTHSPVEILRRAALRPMEELAEATGQSNHLCVLDRDALLVISQVHGPNPVTLSIEEGSRFPLERSTSGQLLLASVAVEDREAILTRSATFKDWSAKRRAGFRSRLALIARQGYNTASSELTQGVADIAALIGRAGGPVIATVTISCVSSELGRTSAPHELLVAVRETAALITRAHGIGP